MISKHSNKSVRIILASLGSLFSYHVMAESSTPTIYEYGMNLDVEKVLSVSTNDSRICNSVNYIMKYIDSSGKIQFLQYRGLSSKCSRGR